MTSFNYSDPVAECGAIQLLELLGKDTVYFDGGGDMGVIFTLPHMKVRVRFSPEDDNATFEVVGG
jgi:hypothetical protein